MTKDSQTAVRVYGYRWVVLAIYFLITVIIEVQWLTFAPIAREARAAYKASPLQIDLLSMIYMGVTMLLCIPASNFIGKHGIRVGIGLGAALTGFFGMFKGLCASSYAMMVVSQIGLGAAQPFIINAVTNVAVKWFPNNERATAVGLGTLAQFVGFIIANVTAPYLTRKIGETYDLQGMLMTYGVISVALAVAFLVLMREKPPTPPSAEGGADRLKTLEGFRHLIRQRDMVLVMILFFFGLGMFNAITTCIDQICEGKGLTTVQSGNIMGVMFVAGIIGALIMPVLSDRWQNRKSFISVAVLLLLPGLIGMTFAHGYVLMLFSSAVLGFFLLGAAGPIGFQYAAEVSYPAPESLSQGIVLLIGQMSGILFVVGMNLTGMAGFMVIFILLSLINVFLSFIIRESPLVRKSG